MFVCLFIITGLESFTMVLNKKFILVEKTFLIMCKKCPSNVLELSLIFYPNFAGHLEHTFYEKLSPTSLG